jgi:hypothetical protein
MSQPLAFVEMTRAGSLSNRLRAFAVMIDGRKVDKLKVGETKRFALPSGAHEIRVGLDFYKSNPLGVDLRPGETLVLECGDKGPKTIEETFSIRALGDSLSAIASPASFMYIRIVDRGAAGNPYNQGDHRDDTASARGPSCGEPGVARDSGPMIFLSYRRDDSEQITGRIRDRLSARFGERSIFRDVDSIPVGSRFRDKIEETLKAAKIMIVIIGPQWVEALDRQGRRRLDQADDPVRFELETALGLKLPIVPVLVKQATMPAQEELPPSLSVLPGINAVIMPAEPYFSDGMARLKAAVESLTAPVHPQAPEAPKRFCAGCGRPINPNQAFCTQCGRRVA